MASVLYKKGWISRLPYSKVISKISFESSSVAQGATRDGGNLGKPYVSWAGAVMKVGPALCLPRPPLRYPVLSLTTATGKAEIVVIKQGVNVGALLNNCHDL